MNGLLLDTSALIYLFERKDSVVIDLVRSHGGEFVASLMSLAELHRGAESAADRSVRAARQRTIAAVQMHAEIAVPTSIIAKRWGALAAATPRSVGANDLWIAATGLELSLTLVAGDKRLVKVVEQAKGHAVLVDSSM